MANPRERPVLLVVTMGTDYIAPARMPFELQRVGFRVALLVPRHSLAAHTGHCDRIRHFPDDVRLLEWIHVLATTMREVDPLLILPGDDITVRTLMQLVLDPPSGLPASLAAELGAVIRRSLGEPEGWLDSIDKTRLFELARRNGIAVADGAIATSEDEAVAIAAQIGYPVMLRLMFGTAGSGAARCEGPAAVRATIRGFRRPEAWVPGGAARFVVQRFVTGDVVTRASLAWDGREVAGVTRGRLATYPTPLNAASAVEFTGLPAVTAATGRLFALLGMHGFVGTQFIVDAATSVPFLIEVNRRMLPATHAGAHVGIDLAAALRDVVAGRPWRGPIDLPPGRGLRLALFPQEWYRDGASAWLRTLPSDAPWHDPALFAAMLRLRAETAPGIPAGAHRDPAHYDLTPAAESTPVRR